MQTVNLVILKKPKIFFICGVLNISTAYNIFRMAKTEDGSAYSGPWIAAMQPVYVPRDDEELQDQEVEADLLVLVQYRLETVLEPVKQMSRTLMIYGAAVLGSILIVTFTLWWLVRRAGSAGTEKATESKKEQEMVETIQAS